MLRKLLLTAGTAVLCAAAPLSAANAEKVKIALIEGLSGPFAANGLAALRELEFGVGEFLAGKQIGGSKLEIEANGAQAEDAVRQLGALIDARFGEEE